jgi:hypothetical protein
LKLANEKLGADDKTKPKEKKKEEKKKECLRRKGIREVKKEKGH